MVCQAHCDVVDDVTPDEVESGMYGVVEDNDDWDLWDIPSCIITSCNVLLLLRTAFRYASGYDGKCITPFISLMGSLLQFVISSCAGLFGCLR